MEVGSGPEEGSESEGEKEARYHTGMIDQGFCFNAAKWNFPDAPLRGLYARNGVYVGVTWMDSSEPWLERLRKADYGSRFGELAQEIPPDMGWKRCRWRPSRHGRRRCGR